MRAGVWVNIHVRSTASVGFRVEGLVLRLELGLCLELRPGLESVSTWVKCGALA